MRKGFLIMLAVVLVAAIAAPAMAGLDATGFIRDKGYVSNFKNAGNAPVLQKDAPAAAYVEQRLRLKFSFGEENVKAVWFLESDFGAFGDSAGSAPPANTTGGAFRNSGGALGGDRINTETKNIYIWFKVPNTSLDVTAGLQNQSDSYAGLLFGYADMAGFFANGKVEPLSYRLGWAKLYENNNLKADDLTLYVAEAKFAPIKELKLGLNFYFIQDDTGKVSLATELPADPGVNLNKKRIYTPGVDVSFNAGPATVSGFALYQFGKIDFLNPATKDVDIRGYAVDARVDLNAGPGKAFLEAIYVSGGDDKPGEEYRSIKTLSDMNASPGENSFFARTDMQLLLPNLDDINTSTALAGAFGTPSGGGLTCATSPGNCGRGITHVAGGFTMKLADKLTGKVGAGYLAASKKFSVADATKKGKGMGTEVNANVNYNILKGLDFGLYGAYAWLGDFYKSTAPGAVDPDNIYDVHFRLNYAF